MRRLLEGWTAATQWAIANPEAGAALYVEHYPESNYESVLASWKSVASIIESPDTKAHGLGWQNPAVWEGITQFMYDGKLTDSKVDATASFSNAYLPVRKGD